MNAAAILWSLVKRADLKSTVDLQPQQTRVVDKMKKEPGLLVYHGLGSGKTLASIAAGDAIPGPKEVVVPASLRGNYAKELKKFRKGHSPDFNVESYNAAAARDEMPEAGLTILDEAHRTGREGTAVSQIGQKAKGKVMLLTGTPVRNEPSEIVPLLRAIAKDRNVPSTAQKFNDRFIHQEPIYDGLFGRLMGKPIATEKKLVNQDELKKLFEGRVDYHPSSGDFPTTTDEHIDVPMSPEQTQLYNGLAEKNPALAYKVKHNLPPSKQESTQLNAFLAAVRQVSNNPSAYDVRKGGDVFEHSPKLQRMAEEIKKRSEDPHFKGVVYSNYIDSGINPLAEHLNTNGIPTSLFTGQLNDQMRKKVVDDYNRGKTKVLAISGAGSEGLDLKGTQLMQIMEPHWNKPRVDQVIGRAVRHMSHAGLPPDKQNVHIQRYYATPQPGFLQRWGLSEKDTGADRYLMNMSEKKQKLVDQLLQVLQEVGSSPANKK